MENVVKTKPLHHFELDGAVCVIDTPDVPRPWSNYLWNDDGYCAQFTQVGDGDSIYLDGKLRTCRLLKGGGRGLLFRDEATGRCWHLSGQAPLDPVSDFRCEHAIERSTLSSRHGDVYVSWTIRVPASGTREIWDIAVENAGSGRVDLSVFSYLAFDLGGFPHPRYYEAARFCATEQFPDGSGVYCRASHPYAPHGRCSAYLSSPVPPFALDGDMDAFCGSSSRFQAPRTVLGGGHCAGRMTAFSGIGAALEHRIVLSGPGRVSLPILAGLAESLEEAISLTAAAGDTASRARSAREERDRLKQRYSASLLRTPDPRINVLMNDWVRKQIDFCLVGKKGVRDNLQAAVALLQFRPDRAAAEIRETLSHQFEAGHSVFTWLPYDETRYSDQPFWIIYSVAEWLKETGDFSVLAEPVPFQDGGTGTILQHLRAAARVLAEDRGPHGLSRIRTADWNDALNISGDPEAESAMLSAQACIAFAELAEIAEITGDRGYARELRSLRAEFIERINAHCWDGSGYVRALHKDGAVGSLASGGDGVLYANAQIWPILAGVPDAERRAAALARLDGMMHDFGLPLCDPPYRSFDPRVGRMSAMLPGLFENGGAYCHVGAFKMYMDCGLGRADAALDTLHRLMPDNEANPSARSGADPHVFTNCYSLHPSYYGKSYKSWRTGTAAWAMRGLYEGLSGVRAHYDGLRVNPCLPSGWNSISLERSFRGTRFLISVVRSGLGPEKRRVRVDGEPYGGEVLPLSSDGRPRIVEVEV